MGCRIGMKWFQLTTTASAIGPFIIHQISLLLLTQQLQKERPHELQ